MGFLQSAAWLKARRQALLNADWCCQRCGVSLLNKPREAQCHHRKPRSVAPALLLEPLNIEVLCRVCHRGAHSRGEEIAPAAELVCDLNGHPTDPAHPWNALGGWLKNRKVPTPSAARQNSV